VVRTRSRWGETERPTRWRRRAKFSEVRLVVDTKEVEKGEATPVDRSGYALNLGAPLPVGGVLMWKGQAYRCDDGTPPVRAA